MRQTVRRSASGLSHQTSLLASSRMRGLAASTDSGREAVGGATEEDVADEAQDENVLEGKDSGVNLRRAFAARAAAAMRYDYFAQRAELEAELEAAGTFRSLKAVAEQQALGFLELLEEYGSPCDEAESVTIGATLDNVASAALAEKGDVEVYEKFAETAGKEELEQLSEWMCDMGDASERIASRLELVSSLMDEEFENLTEEEVETVEQTGKITS